MIVYQNTLSFFLFFFSWVILGVGLFVEKKKYEQHENNMPKVTNKTSLRKQI